MKKINEPRTIRYMIEIYCRKNHRSPGGWLCPECRELLDYSLKRLAGCSLLPDKPVCSNCRIHCYKAEKRESIRKVMRFSGPRMLLYHPMIGMLYLRKKRSERAQNSR
jgi:hypothetical protein